MFELKNQLCSAKTKPIHLQKGAKIPAFLLSKSKYNLFLHR